MTNLNLTKTNLTMTNLNLTMLQASNQSYYGYG